MGTLTLGDVTNANVTVSGALGAVKATRWLAGADVAVDVTVLVAAQQADITVMINDKPHLRWRGPLSALSAPAGCRQPNAACVAMGARWGTVAFKNARLRMLTGQAGLIR